jgi:hypothetical protein
LIVTKWVVAHKRFSRADGFHINIVVDVDVVVSLNKERLYNLSHKSGTAQRAETIKAIKQALKLNLPAKTLRKWETSSCIK